jgi:TolB protein
MTSDDGKGTPIDVRARRAAREFRTRVSQLGPHVGVDLERFEEIRHRRRRNERYRAIVVAAIVSAVVAFTIVRILPLKSSTPIGRGPSVQNGQIVFGRSAVGLDTQRSLFTISPDGSGERRLPISYTDCGQWSPDGSRLFVTSSEYPGAPLRPAVVNSDGRGFELFDTSAPSSLNLGCGDWSPDGTRLVLEGFGDVSAVDGIYSLSATDGSGLMQLTHGHDIVPQYAPDGSKIVFERASPSSGLHAGAAALFVVGSDGSGLRRITPWGSALSSGSWSTNGRIVFSGPDDTLRLVDPDGSDLTRIRVDLGGRPFQPRWSPDGTTIVFGLKVGGQTDLYSVRPDGTDLAQLTHTPDADEWWPDWGVA